VAPESSSSGSGSDSSTGSSPPAPLLSPVHFSPSSSEGQELIVPVAALQSSEQLPLPPSSAFNLAPLPFVSPSVTQSQIALPQTSATAALSPSASFFTDLPATPPPSAPLPLEQPSSSAAQSLQSVQQNRFPTVPQYSYSEDRVNVDNDLIVVISPSPDHSLSHRYVIEVCWGEGSIPQEAYADVYPPTGESQASLIMQLPVSIIRHLLPRFLLLARIRQIPFNRRRTTDAYIFTVFVYLPLDFDIEILRAYAL